MSLETVQATATTECPVVTLLPISLQEASGVVLPELRAYKLGKKRWSYNQVEITLCEEGGNKQLQVKEAAHAGASTRNPSGVSYELTLMNDEKLTLEAYLVYDCPKAVSIAPANGNGARTNVHEW